jgi:HEPN domain-containing protein
MTIDHEFALEFIRKAEQDLSTASFLLTGEDFFTSACFHCQQLAEKAIKALLTYNSIRFKKIHNLDVLLSLLNDPDFKDVWQYAEILNTFAVDTRYPGEYAEPEREDAEEALRMATEIYDLVKQKLGL